MFSSLLVANRGEIACRVMRTARRLGLRTIAVYSEADADALHVREAHEAHCIGAAPARDSYLHIGRILDAARASGAQAIHPGYGFLSESAPFAQACSRAGIVFVGPPESAIRAMGSKAAAKALLAQAGVPLTPGFHGADQDPARLAAEAAHIGFPVLIKASAGGGGKGMRRVDRAADFPAALAACRREALAAFGDDVVLIEKYIEQPRHIEVQVFADTHGNAVHLFERDCSVQRRHQKVLEEAPAPGVSPQRRAALGRAALQVVRAVGYVGAGTVEFIAPRALAPEAPEAGFYFMEMNTRLQVEHPVTEMITGLDLVEWQLRVAAGEALPLDQAALTWRGHAIEARLYAEDADQGYLPATGTLAFFAGPPPAPYLRLDAGVQTGDRIGPHYDPMIGKLIAWGETRDAARLRLRDALAQTCIVGVVSNLAFLGRLVEAPSFAAALLDTDLLERDAAALAPPTGAPAPTAWLLVALATLAAESGDAETAQVPPDGCAGAWCCADSWRANLAPQRRLQLSWRGPADAVLHDVWAGPAPAARDAPAAVLLTVGGQQYRCRAQWHRRVPAVPQRPEAWAGTLRAHIDGRVFEALTVRHAGRWHLFHDGRHDSFALAGALAADTPPESAADEGVRAPMPGKLIALLAAPGSRVARNAPLLIVEAMKMEHTVRAPRAGVLRAFRVAVGDQVAMGEFLADLEPDPPAAAGPAP